MRALLRNIAVTGLAVGVVATGAPADALTINLIDTGGVTGSKAAAGFRAAADYWESVLTNNATVNINVGFSDLGSSTLGGTVNSVATYFPISAYEGLLAGSAASTLDSQALAHLPPIDAAGGVEALVPGYKGGVLGVMPGSSRVAPDAPINSTLGMTTANLKALGIDLGAGFVDAQINFSSTFAFDFDAKDGIAAGKYDFMGVAVHELGHALGFMSGVDDFDLAAGSWVDADSLWWAYPLDLFRYSKEAGSPMLDWTMGSDSYFSLDDGQSAYLDGYFSTGAAYGDGRQASHWKQPGAPCDPFRGVMNPYLCDGVNGGVTALDLAALDVIGWNLDVDVATHPNYFISTSSMGAGGGAPGVPEPETWDLMLLGLGMAGVMIKRRRAAA